MFATLVKTSDGIFLVCNGGDASVQADESEAALVRMWESMYHQAHGRGFERSMSACVHFLFFQPSVIQFEDTDDLLSFIENEDGKVMPYSLSSVAGSLSGFKCTEAGEARWESGTKPTLL